MVAENSGPKIASMTKERKRSVEFVAFGVQFRVNATFESTQGKFLKSTVHFDFSIFLLRNFNFPSFADLNVLMKKTTEYPQCHGKIF